VLNPAELELTLTQEIFYARSTDGVTVTFGMLKDGRCAVARAGRLIRAWSADRPGIYASVAYFRRLTGVPRSANMRRLPRADTSLPGSPRPTGKQ
jgi:hypothetical protein